MKKFQIMNKNNTNYENKTNKSKKIKLNEFPKYEKYKIRQIYSKNLTEENNLKFINKMKILKSQELDYLNNTTSNINKSNNNINKKKAT